MIQAWPIRTLDSLGQSDWLGVACDPGPANQKHSGSAWAFLAGGWSQEPPLRMRGGEPGPGQAQVPDLPGPERDLQGLISYNASLWVFTLASLSGNAGSLL